MLHHSTDPGQPIGVVVPEGDRGAHRTMGDAVGLDLATDYRRLVLET